MTGPTLMSFQRVEELEGSVADAVLAWTLSLADTKHKMGIRISEWVNGGPALEAAVGASAMTQDELGHARSLFAIVKDFPGAPAGVGAENDLEARDEYYCPRVLDESWASWMDVIAVNVLLDRALNIAVEAFRDSSFGPLRGRAAKILQEEEFHRIFGDSWLARLARWDENKHGQLQSALDHHWSTALAWFGPEDDAQSRLLVDNGILHAGPAELRARWLAEVTGLLQKNKLELPDSALDWSAWNSTYRDLA